jgi:hypothetical protein
VNSVRNSNWSIECRNDQLIIGGEVTDDIAGVFAIALHAAGVHGPLVINLSKVRSLAPSAAIALQRAAHYLHERGEQLMLVDASVTALQTLTVLGLTDRPFLRIDAPDGPGPGAAIRLAVPPS